jgi:hypothetical protein
VCGLVVAQMSVVYAPVEMLERRLLRLHLQVHRRGFVMPYGALRSIVEQRMVRELFKHWRKEREASGG